MSLISVILKDQTTNITLKFVDKYDIMRSSIIYFLIMKHDKEIGLWIV
jgi:hypothetical protein